MATKTLEIKFKVDGVLTNATSALLSDPTGTFGVKRNDTNAVVVADGTAMTNAATGIYRYTFTKPADGLTYTWWAEILYAGSTYRFERLFEDSPTADTWYYSDRTGVLTVQDVANITVVWDQDNDGTEDIGLMTSDGVTADGYIDLALVNLGRTIGANDHAVDVTAASAYIVSALRDISNHLTVWYGWHHRGGIERVAKPNEISGLMSGYKAYADEQLAKLAGVLIRLDEDDTTTTPGVFESVGVIDSSEQCTTDENGNLTPVSWW